MQDIKFDIKNYSSNRMDLSEDLICTEKVDRLSVIISCSLLCIVSGNRDIKVKFEWREENELIERNILPITESQMIVVSSTNQWVMISLNQVQIIRHEASQWSPSIYKVKTTLIVEDDLRSESMDLNGNTIDSVSIDPPTQATEFTDRIEYVSPISGKQILRLNHLPHLGKS